MHAPCEQTLSAVHWVPDYAFYIGNNKYLIKDKKGVLIFIMNIRLGRCSVGDAIHK